MPPTVTDRVAWSVGLSVGVSPSEPGADEQWQNVGRLKCWNEQSSTKTIQRHVLPVGRRSLCLSGFCRWMFVDVCKTQDWSCVGRLWRTDETVFQFRTITNSAVCQCFQVRRL